MVERRKQSTAEELVKNALNGIYQSSPEGEFLTVNPALVRLIGYETEGELRAERFGDPVVDETSKALLKDHLRESNEIKNVEIALKAKDGPAVDALLNARAVRTADGAFLYHEGILTDITHLKRHEEQLLHQAAYDPLSALRNRREFNVILDRYLSGEALRWAGCNPVDGSGRIQGDQRRVGTQGWR